MQAEALLRNQKQVQAIHDHLLMIRRNMERLISENRLLRDQLGATSQQLQECQEECSALQQRVRKLDEERSQLRQCVDDALDQVEHALAEVVEEEGEGDE